jgi:hypothetical protein
MPVVIRNQIIPALKNLSNIPTFSLLDNTVLRIIYANNEIEMISRIADMGSKNLMASNGRGCKIILSERPMIMNA